MTMRPSSAARRFGLLAGAAGLVALAAAQPAAAATNGAYQVKPLVGQTKGQAPAFDPALKNPWGLAASATGKWWVGNNGTPGKPETSIATVYDGAGVKSGVAVPVLSTPGKIGGAGVTGVVSSGKSFVFSNLDGSISKWTAGDGNTTAAQVVVKGQSAITPTNPAGGNFAVYTGLAVSGSGDQTKYYAPNELTKSIDVFDANFNKSQLAHDPFADAADHAGLTTFGAQTIGNSLFVTYATPGPQADDQGLGKGAVDVYDLTTGKWSEFAAGGPLSSPWGIAQAPGDFGKFSNDVLIGNFNSDGLAVINAFDSKTGAFAGTLKDSKGKDIVLPGLWALQFGNGLGSGPKNSLYFTSGPGEEESGGLFGSIAAIPEPATWALLIAGFGAVGVQLRARRRPGLSAV